MAQVSRTQIVDIVNAWENNLSSMSDLSKKYGLTRQGIYKILRKAGADTTKHRLVVSCNTCGKPTPKTRKQARTRKHVFCSQVCYFAWLKANSIMEESRYGSRCAREKVKALWSDLADGNIVHHVNGKELDNRLENLSVYRYQGDHIRAHRGFDVEPIWRGVDHV